MSYEIVRSISIKKDGNIYITGASNNVRPLYYSTWNYSSIPQEERMFSLFTGIISGTYHLQPSVSKRIRYAMLKTNEYIGKNALNTYEMYCNCPKYKYEKLAKEMGIKFTFERHNYSTEYTSTEEAIRTYYYANYSEEERNKLDYESEHKAYDEIFNVFMDAYNNYVDDKKKWVIKMQYDSYLKKLNTRTYTRTCSKDNALILDTIRANEMLPDVIVSCYDGATLEEYEG